jgi:SagB-type dehydrogenase family enzyme
MLGVSFGISRLISAVDTPLRSNSGEQRSHSSHQPKKNTMETAEYSEKESIALPEPAMQGEMSIEEALLKRRSVRRYAETPLSMQQISQLLWSAYGISDSTTYSRRKLRTAPSAGAVYPLEVYLMVRNVTGLTAGLYRYNPDNHSLTLYSEGDISKAVAEACLDQMMLHQAPASMIYTAVWSKIKARYGDRGVERYLCMDIGHSAQNVYLQATAMGLATCAVGAFDDKKLAAVINPPDGEQMMYLLPLGVPMQ